jgi:hypothetical protein
VNIPGNPRVKITDPYPYPCTPVPVKQGYGYGGVWVGGMTGMTDLITCVGGIYFKYSGGGWTH